VTGSQRLGGADPTLGGVALIDGDLSTAVAALVEAAAVAGRKVAVVVPDATRSVPLRRIAAHIDAALADAGAAAATWVVALGTHQPMGDGELAAHVGHVAGSVVNHAWWDPDTLVEVGTVTGPEVAELTGGRLRDPVPVRLNRHVVDADVALLVGPVFPHEVVGFSGGTKYLVPGVAGPEIIDATHWLGALLTSAALIGVVGPNPVRALVDRAAALLPADQWCLAVVVAPGTTELVHAAAGRPRAAWAEAAAVAARTHIRWLDRPVHHVLSVVPARYPDLWTAAKGMYKVEPVVADGGEVVLYAPHVTTTSVTHGDLLAKIGYHTRDYYLGQWDRFAGVPGGVLAHSTHLTGAGRWSPEDGEQPRVRVTLATGISKADCRALNLGYRDPATVDVDVEEAAAAADPDRLVVRNAGEQLYRLR
jgi:nickel-dependent lactate racemase